MTLRSHSWRAGLTGFEKERPTKGKASSQRKLQEFPKQGLNTKSFLPVQKAEPPLPTAALGKGDPPPRRSKEAPNQPLPPRPEPTALCFRDRTEDCTVQLRPSAPLKTRLAITPLRPVTERSEPAARRLHSSSSESSQLDRTRDSAARVASLERCRAPPPGNRTPHCRHRLLAHRPAAPPSLVLAAARRCGRVSKERRNRVRGAWAEAWVTRESWKSGPQQPQRLGMFPAVLLAPRR